MRVIFDWIDRNLHTLTFVLLECVSFVLLFQFNSYHGSLWFTSANSVVSTIRGWEAEAISYVHLGTENRILTERNVILQIQLSRLREQLKEATRDSSLTERLMAERLDSLRMLDARVIGNSITKRDNFITIDRGSRDGVRPEMGVVTGTGVVGIVSQVSGHSALVIPVLNSKCRISCRLRGSGYFGYLHWGGGSPLIALLNDIPRHAVLKKGDAVETSGYSSSFPEGIFVGRILQVRNSSDGQSYEPVIVLSADLAKVRNVSVILGKR